MSVPPFASLRAAAADERPVLVVLAGPNGAGKSTFFAQHLHGLGLLFVNADHIARLLRDAEPGLPRLQLERRAFDEAERLRADLIDLRFGFCTETVFSDPAGAKLDFMERARSAGFVVLLLFIGLAGPVTQDEPVLGQLEAGPERAGARVAVRDAVKQPMGLVHGGLYASIAESLTSVATAVAVYADGRVAERFPPLPRWTRGLPGL